MRGIDIVENIKSAGQFLIDNAEKIGADGIDFCTSVYISFEALTTGSVPDISISKTYINPSIININTKGENNE